MRRSFAAIVAAAVGTGVVIGACSDGDSGGGDLAAFCASVTDLADNDPFADLDLASPEEMRAAFDDLRSGVDAIADDAPEDLEGRADRYLATVDELVDQLRGAGFDPRQLDTLRYRTAAADYEEAAISIENAAADACP